MARPVSGHATVRMIAAEAGVSPATVSRVLNGSGSVTPETVARVRAAVAAVGKGMPATRRRNDANRRVFVRCPYVLTDYFGFIVSSVAESLQQAGWRVELDAGNASQQRHPLRAIASRTDVAGAVVILPPDPVDELAAVVDAGFPLVVVDPRAPLPEGIATVSANHVAASRRLTDHLVDLGHRRVASIVGPAHWRSSVERTAGIASALATVGVLPDPELVRACDPTFEGGLAAAAELLDHPDRPTALLCFNDKVAVGALRAAADRGLRVPQDLSITGFDDLDVGHVTEPPLTTVRQPMEEMGRLAVSLLLRLIGGEPPEHKQVEVATRLVVRGSTGPAPARD